MTDRRQAKLAYKLSHRSMGVFQIRNTVNQKIFIDSSLDMPAKINRHKFQLNAGNHPAKELQKDWNEKGQEQFEFEILEPVLTREDPAYDYRADLNFLENLWLEKLKPYGDNGYNQPKRSREERLRMIAQKRTGPT